MKTKITILSLLILVSTSVCFGQKAVAKAFEAESNNGKSIDSEALKGKIVVLYFWSTNCLICQGVSPKLNSIVDKFDKNDIVFLAITSDPKTKVVAYIKNHPMKFDIISGNIDLLFKYGETDAEGNSNMLFPTLFVVNRKGEIELKSVGAKLVKEVEKSLEMLTAK